jgi:hypothetical protein
MAIYERGRKSDGVISMEGGMDGGLSPSLIKKNQCAYAENTTFRGGYAKTRPAFRNVPLDGGADATAMLAAKFQGAGHYDESGYQHIIVVAGGNVYKVSPPASGEVWTVTDITGTATLSATVERVHIVQADAFLIIQDGQNQPFIFGFGMAAGRNSDPATKEVPIGTGPMAYGNGRLWVAINRYFVAGDILGGTSNVITFSENSYIDGGGAFSVPQGVGKITAMEFLTSANTPQGKSELMVYTSDGAFSVNVPPDRYDWYALTDPVQRVVLANSGAMSQASTVSVNSDQYIRSRDGVRSLKQALAGEVSQPTNSPISREVRSVLETDAQTWLQYSSAVLFENRYLLTTGATQHATSGISFGSLVALDFDPMNGARYKQPPVWDGVWKMTLEDSGVSNDMRFLHIFTGRFDEAQRCFAAMVRPDHTWGIWELAGPRQGRHDADTSDGGTTWSYTGITSVIETPSFSFGEIGSAKKLESGDLWVDSVAGEVTFTTHFRPDQYPCWVGWQTWSVSAEECLTVEDCNDVCAPKLQYRPRMRIARPTDEIEEATKKPYNYGWEFSARLEWKGHARLKLFRFNVRETEEESYSDVINANPTQYKIDCDCT